MKATRPSEVRALLQQLDLKPSKVLGQNFLIDENILGIVLDHAAVTRTDQVAEIGPGLGVLTAPLAEAAGRVIAVEKDRRLYRFLKDTLGGFENLELIHGDAMDLAWPGLLESGINKVVANLPYSIGSRLLVDLFESVHRPEAITVTVQQEVAQRLAADPDNKTYGVLSVFAQFHYRVKVVKTVSPTCFLPRPAVKSAVVQMTLRDQPAAAIRDPALFKSLVKYCFSQRRKQLTSILAHAPAPLRMTPGSATGALGQLGLEGKVRPENLTVSQWGALSDLVSGLSSGG